MSTKTSEIKLDDLMKNGDAFFVVIEDAEGIPIGVVNKPTEEDVRRAMAETPGAYYATIWSASGSFLSKRGWDASGASHEDAPGPVHIRKTIEHLLCELNAAGATLHN